MPLLPATLAALAALAHQASPAPAAPAALRAALERALAVPGGRLEVGAFRAALPAGCLAEEAEVPRPVAASGQTTVRLRGHAGAARCDGWGWAAVRVFAPALVARRDVAEGEPVAPAVSAEEREVSPGRVPLRALPPGARAARAIPGGIPIEAGHLRLGPRPGESVAVLLRVGDVAVVETGRALPCARARACALLPSGRRVEGRFDGTRILLESP